MKIETITLQFAVQDDVSRDDILKELAAATLKSDTILAMDVRKVPSDLPPRGSGRRAARTAGPKFVRDKPKRKYTCHPKPAAPNAPPASGSVPVSRSKREDGTVIESRGNCQGGGAAI